MKTSHIIITSIFLSIFSLSVYGQTNALTKTEKKELRYLMQEEKLARDVYLTLNEKWDRPVFQNITGAEVHHLDMVKQMAIDNNISLPKSIINDVRGEFDDEKLQALYSELIAQGNLSLVDALKAGAKIEELDISDLKHSLANTKNESLTSLYSKLIGASERHLRAFTNNLKQQGVTYEPIILETEYFAEIVGTTNGKACAGQAAGQGTGCCSGKGKGGQGMGAGKGKACCQSK
ncbi:MAG: DUF2202 domain-containing protein [Chitinophagales bacterium]